ncbi:MAG: hypothetical protein L6305_08150 [Actinomycetia bacterium]|nr:hypothetical protein [Actinomycetes bacterium]
MNEFMSKIEEIVQSKLKPKEIQIKLVEAVTQKKIPAGEFVAFFESASDVDKGTCADVMKHVSAANPEILAPYIDVLVDYINYRAPRVKWGVPEAIGNLARKYPEKVEKAIPNLLQNTAENKINTTVIRWCAAYGLTEIAKNNPGTRKVLLPIFSELIKKEKNNGVRNVYIKAVKVIEKEK